MDERTTAWLRAQLGATPDTADLAARYARLGSARAVAAEVLRERRAALLAEPLRVTVDGVVTIDQSQNLAGVERQMKALGDDRAPDDVVSSDEPFVLATAPLRSERRR